MSASTTAAALQSAPHAVRPFYWSVRREIWENRGVYLAPLAVAVRRVEYVPPIISEWFTKAAAGFFSQE